MSDQLVTVTGTYVLADDTPAQGTVLLTPVVVAGMSATTKRLVTRHSVMGRLDSEGTVTLAVLASDDPDWMMSGPVLYEVAEYIAGARGKAYQVHIPGPGPVDLADLQPVEVAGDTVAPYPVPGPTGPANSLTIGTVSTLPPGSDATASIHGAPPAQVLDLGLPKGVTGNPQDTSLNDLTDVDTTRDATGMVITRQPDGTYKGQHVRVALNQLTDVTAPAATPPNSLLGTVGEGTTPGQAEWEPLHLDYIQSTVLGPLPSTVADLGQRVTELEHTGEIVPPDLALTVDLYGGSFTRIIGADAVTATPKRITVSLALSPGPNGAIFPSLADISGTGAVWADFAGVIGKAVDTSGTGINGASLKEAIRRGQIVTVHRGSDGTHPTLVVERVEDPADAGSSLTLDALKNVSAPASTPAGMFLGTTAVDAWGPVANPTAGVWPGKTRTSRPNSTDRLVEVWDGAAWAVVHYDSGWRDVGALMINGWTNGYLAQVQRTHMGLTIKASYWQGTPATSDEVLLLPTGFFNAAGQGGAAGTGDPGSPQLGIKGTNHLTSTKGAQRYTALPVVVQIPNIVTFVVPTILPGTLATTAP